MRRSVVPVGAAAAAVAVCGALVAVTSCRDAGGVREEGTASVASPALPSPSVSPPAPDARTLDSGRSAGPRAKDTMGAGDVMRLVKHDPKVAQDIRDSLVACAAPSAATGDRPKAAQETYPVDRRSGRLTGDDGTDLVVNVSTCADNVGIGSYVYRRVGGAYVNVFADEQPPVFAEIGDGTLKVTHQVYEPQDAVSNPSGEDVTTYQWNGSRFEEVAFSHRDYTADDETGSGPHD
ncbi:hypothetical protein [Actinacidiphila sp. bgisy160]|uniref:hypothetical protein n=1 Tax=Actinacidiphila sp. bgisy160 TaxID=3413796 RepID=UPI003D70BF70